MSADEKEDDQLRSVALLAPQGAERKLVAANEALERKTAELAESLAQIRATLESTTDAILVTDGAGKVTGFNENYVALWRMPRETMDARDHWKLLAVAAREFRDGRSFVARVEAIYASSPPESFDLLELADGRVFERYSRVQQVGGQNAGRVWSFRDITERKRADEFRARLAAVVESSDDAILSKTLDGIITTWNNGAQRMFGYTAEEVVGKPVAILIPPERIDEEPSILERLKRGERIDHYETVRRRKDGTLFNISLSVSPVADAQGRIIGASKIARDITDIVKARETLAERRQELETMVAERTASLREAVAQMEEFSYSVSHDLRSPLRAMQGYAKVVLEDYGDKLDAEGREYLQRIVNAGSRMDRLTQDVLNYSKIGQSPMRLELVSLDKLITETIQQYVPSQSLQSAISVEHPLLDAMGYEPLLVQAVSNLLANAVKFVRKGEKPSVRIWTEAHGRHVRLWVEDRGIGITPEFQDRIWGMFERVHPKEPYEGTGIGLAIVRKAVERMGGQVGVQSDGVQGSRFWIQLAGSAAARRAS